MDVLLFWKYFWNKRKWNEKKAVVSSSGCRLVAALSTVAMSFLGPRKIRTSFTEIFHYFSGTSCLRALYFRRHRSHLWEPSKTKMFFAFFLLLLSICRSFRFVCVASSTGFCFAFYMISHGAHSFVSPQSKRKCRRWHWHVSFFHSLSLALSHTLCLVLSGDEERWLEYLTYFIHDIVSVDPV